MTDRPDGCRDARAAHVVGQHDRRALVLADNLDDTSRAVSKLLDRAPAALSADELATIRAHFAAQVRIARAAHPERSYPEILASALDYRRWRVFSFTLIGGDGSEDRLTVARHSALSGGEQSVSLHLPLFAAAHVMLSSADPHSPRLLGLDEAFAGVDDNGRSELLGLSVQFDLDLFMTGYDLWITYPGVPGARTTTWRTRQPNRASARHCSSGPAATCSPSTTAAISPGPWGHRCAAASPPRRTVVWSSRTRRDAGRRRSLPPPEEADGSRHGVADMYRSAAVMSRTDVTNRSRGRRSRFIFALVWSRLRGWKVTTRGFPPPPEPRGKAHLPGLRAQSP